jgi:hypothetical protein
MRPIGFSTGALGHSDFRLGLRILRKKSTRVVELSALREAELAPLINALDTLDLLQFTYVSLHAPSRYEKSREEEIIRLLQDVVSRRWPIILHPDTIYDPSAWESFGDLLLIENMDKRNPTGRTARELSYFFRKLPRAGLCFDIGHCRQVDPTMNESYLILKEFGDRLRQVHVSEVNTRSTHDPLSGASIAAFEKISYLIPEAVPVILESPVQEREVGAEIEKARLALPLVASKRSRKLHLKPLQNAVA